MHTETWSVGECVYVFYHCTVLLVACGLNLHTAAMPQVLR